MSFGGYPNSPSGRIEACIYWHPTAFESRVYYAEPGPSVVADSKYLAEAYKLVNFINSQVWPQNRDGADGRVYSSSYLIQPRFYITDVRYVEPRSGSLRRKGLRKAGTTLQECIPSRSSRRELVGIVVVSRERHGMKFV